MGAAATVLSVGGAILKADSQQKSLKFQRDSIARDMQISRKQFQQKEASQRLQNRRDASSQIVAMSGAGIEYTTGSFAAVTEDADVQRELAALNIRYEGQLAQTQFKDKWAQADFQKDVAKRDAIINVGKSLLGGIGGAGGSSAGGTNPLFAEQQQGLLVSQNQKAFGVIGN